MRRCLAQIHNTHFPTHPPTPPPKTSRGLECITLPSRLGLARVSVVRGWGGPLAGRACIDDYICGREAVHDHLTRWSGIVAGDLTPNQSPHYLCTMKRSYLKLRHLIDCGVTFVGHGLKQDFRMINILIPPAQIVDTVRLFHRPHKRQLSLRFLASWVLRLNIQGNNHDSIEDASAALALYKVGEGVVVECVWSVADSWWMVSDSHVCTVLRPVHICLATHASPPTKKISHRCTWIWRKRARCSRCWTPCTPGERRTAGSP